MSDDDRQRRAAYHRARLLHSLAVGAFIGAVISLLLLVLFLR